MTLSYRPTADVDDQSISSCVRQTQQICRTLLCLCKHVMVQEETVLTAEVHSTSSQKDQVGERATCYLIHAEPSVGGVATGSQIELAFTVAKQPKSLFYEEWIRQLFSKG